MQIRYWFYPDSIGTVTDGSIGAVLTHQFLAAVQRMDIPIDVGNAVRSTIDHLNRNFGQYEEAFTTYSELSTVGRIMALINWLKGMSMDSRIELDEFLSVKIPAFSTPKKTKKMLAITAIAYPENSGLSAPEVRDYSKVYYISNLLDKYDANTTDDQFLEVARDYFDRIGEDEYSPPRYNKLNSQVEYYDRLITANETKIESLDAQIKLSERTLDKYDEGSINRHNELVDEYNALLAKQDSYIGNYNTLVDRRSNLKIGKYCFISVGGGIDLKPSQFKRIYESKSAPRIREISELRSQIRTVGKIARLGTWIRNNVGTGGARINALPITTWNVVKSADGSIMYSYSSKTSGELSMSMSPKANGWRSDVRINGSRDYVEYSDEGKALQVTHSEAGITGTGTVDSKGKHIVFVR